MISPNIPLCDLASLNWVSHRVPSSPAEVGWKRGGGREPFVQGWTHTSRRLRRFFQKTVAGVVVVSFLDIEPH